MDVNTSIQFRKVPFTYFKKGDEAIHKKSAMLIIHGEANGKIAVEHKETGERSCVEDDFYVPIIKDGTKEIDIYSRQWSVALKCYIKDERVGYYETMGKAYISTDCVHPGFITGSKVERLTNKDGEVTSWIAEIEIYCAECYRPMLFKAPMGMSPSHPTTSVERDELRIPIEPA